MSSKLIIDNYFLFNNTYLVILKKTWEYFHLYQIHKLSNYYTIWGILAHFLLPDTHFLLILKFQMALQIACGGFYITYIYPRYLSIPFWNVIVKDIPLYMCDFISHYIPLIYYILFHDLSYQSKIDFFIGYIPFFIYIFSVDFCNLYHIHILDFAKLILTYSYISIFIGYLLFEN